jgi:type IV pilus assembly protein PilW
VSETGFTLIELLIALVLSIVIVGAVYATFNSQQKSFSLTNQKADMQQQGRAAMNLFMRDLRMAGYLVPSAKAIRVVNNNITSGTTPASDEITMLYADQRFDGFKIITKGGTPPTTVTVEVQSGGSFASSSSDYLNKDIILITKDESHSVVRKITRISPGTGGTQRIFTLNSVDTYLTNLTPQFNSSDDDNASYTNGTAYILTIRTYNVQSETLYINDHNDATANGTPQPLAEGAEILQFDFNMAGSTTPVSVPSTIDQIRTVQIYLLMKNNTKDPDYTDTLTYSLGASNHAYTPGSSTTLKFFRRRLLTSLVRLRNFGL